MNRRTFGTFEVDLDTGELRKSGTRLRLQEKPFQLLALLLDRPGEVVTREVVCQRLWPAGTFVDFDHGLNTAVRKLRQALGDSADNPRFVETVARRGYRFIAPVANPTVAGPAGRADVLPSGTPETVVEPELPSLRGVRGLAIGVAVVLALASIAWMATRPRPQDVAPASTSAGTASMSVAVLPFRVLSSNDSDKSLGTGIADAVIARLASIRGLHVRPISAVFRYNADGVDPRRAGQELDADHVLAGTLQKRENDYRVTVLLQRTSDGAAIWGQSYDVPHADLLKIEDQASTAVAEALRIELTPTDRQQRLAPHNPAAYEPYLQARGLLLSVLLDIRSEALMRASIAAFERAILLDPDYALAHAGLAMVLAQYSVRYEHERDALEWGRRADKEATLALTLDPGSAEAHLAIASTAGTLYGHFNWPRVLAEVDTAVAIDPSIDLAFRLRARAQYHLGLFDSANEAVATALSLNPSVEAERIRVAVDLFGGRFEAVRSRGEKLMKESETPVVKTYVGAALFYLDDRERAAELLASVKRGDQPDARSQAALAGVLAALGKTVEARAVIDRLIRGPYMDHHVAYSLGGAFAQLHRPVEALRWLRTAFDDGFPCYPWFEQDPMLDPIRGDARYQNLMRELRVQFEATRSRYETQPH